MIGGPARRIPRGFSVENDVVNRDFGNSSSHAWIILEQPIARVQLDIPAILERQHSDTVKLALEKPFRTAEPFLRQRSSHRFIPLGEPVVRQDPLVLMLLRHTKTVYGVALEIELDNNCGFVSDDCSVVSRINGHDLWCNEVLFTTVGILDLNVTAH